MYIYSGKWEWKPLAWTIPVLKVFWLFQVFRFWPQSTSQGINLKNMNQWWKIKLYIYRYILLPLFDKPMLYQWETYIYYTSNKREFKIWSGWIRVLWCLKYFIYNIKQHLQYIRKKKDVYSLSSSPSSVSCLELGFPVMTWTVKKIISISINALIYKQYSYYIEITKKLIM